MARLRKGKDGLYTCGNGISAKKGIGTRAEVWHKTACKTSGGLSRDKLHYNEKTHRIVSKKKHLTAKKEKRLEKFGFFTKKGFFGFVKKDKGTKKTKKNKKSKRGKKRN